MNLKRYRVHNIQEALQQIKKDLGPDAVIVSTRKVREGTGAFGMFGKTMLEVTAAKDTQAPKNKPPAAAPVPPQRTEPAPPPATGYPPPRQTSHSYEDTQKALLPIKQEIQEIKDLLSSLKGNVPQVENRAVNQLQSEMVEIRNLMQSLATQHPALNPLNFPENLMILYQQMIFNGLEEKFAKRIIQEVQKNISQEELQNFAYVKIFIARMLMKIIKTTGGLAKTPHQQKIVTFIGPTGVGKTTTAAKIASEQILHQKQKTALLTVDTFRIGAVEQLRTYAKIMEVPLKVVSTAPELRQAIEGLSDYDLLLIDVGGRSQRDEMQMFELKELFHRQEGIEHLLVLSATTKDVDLKEITRRFGELPISSVVFTKLDESTTYGSLFNHVIRFKKPISFLTTGQKVPEDLEVATKERLVDLLLNISGN